MTPEQITQERKGTRLTVIHCDGALASLKQALERLPNGKKKQQSMLNWIDFALKRIANGDRLSNHNFPREGVIAGSNGKHFYGMKKIPIRGYFWHSSKRKATVYVSHYVYKDYDKLDKVDEDKVSANYRKVEV